MRVVNYTEFRNNLAENLNVVSDDNETVVVARSKGKNVVVMSPDEYNSLQETMYLNSTAANRKFPEEAIKNMMTGSLSGKN
jgi:antitoxin YefM